MARIALALERDSPKCAGADVSFSFDVNCSLIQEVVWPSLPLG
jgi:hypothetical protein